MLENSNFDWYYFTGCLHLHALTNEKANMNGRCMAFPDGIPLDILCNIVLHNVVFEEQLGNYVFEEVD